MQSPLPRYHLSLTSRRFIREPRLHSLSMPRELEMGLELLRRHVRTGRVQLLRAVQATDARQPDVLCAWGRIVNGHRELGDRVEGPVLHDGLETVTLGVLLLEVLEGGDEPFWWRWLQCKVSFEPGVKEEREYLQLVGRVVRGYMEVLVSDQSEWAAQSLTIVTWTA